MAVAMPASPTFVFATCALHHLALALQHAQRRTHSRLLSLWLEMLHASNRRRKAAANVADANMLWFYEDAFENTMQLELDNARKMLPASTWLPYIAELGSVLNTHGITVMDVVEAFLVDVLVASPAKAAWLLAGDLYSWRHRRKAMAIVAKVATQLKHQTDALTTMHEVWALVEYLEGVATARAVGESVPVVAQPPSSAILVPTRQNLYGVGPPIFIKRFETTALVFNTLTTPRVLELLASDGCRYRFLLKHDDKGGDVRKDTRVLEFCDALKRLGAPALRTPLQWVPHTLTLGDAVADVGVIMPPPPVLEEWTARLWTYRDDRSNANCDAYAAFFKTEIQPKFKDDEAIAQRLSRTRWRRGRLLGTSSDSATATWTTFSWILITTGDCVHVDFDRIFDEGAYFDDHVPCRLTPAVVRALGVDGVDGAFRATCEQTLVAARSHQRHLRAVLAEFVHAPVKSFVFSSLGGEALDKYAEAKVAMVRDRIRGHWNFAASAVEDAANVPLPTDVIVSRLIDHSTAPDRLALMLVGFMAHL
ncbi:phosphatidylinositol kinase (PIK-L4) [Achlya hypogyna]|uniref:Phosphatidylinositol kinase (PIK-L4) n=1 Tax=Achlya hypogyna TaxID=1202772 RepID=A0A1V9YQV3_ACHHY|nr:phosphatidylinositol kinase (PIK-L4) [Achlya hypogyna]